MQLNDYFSSERIRQLRQIFREHKQITLVNLNLGKSQMLLLHSKERWNKVLNFKQLTQKIHQDLQIHDKPT